MPNRHDSDTILKDTQDYPVFSECYNRKNATETGFTQTIIQANIAGPWDRVGSFFARFPFPEPGSFFDVQDRKSTRLNSSHRT